MRIHTNTAESTDLVASHALRAARDAGQVAQSVYFDKNNRHGSRTHASSADVHLVSWSGGPGTNHPRRPNTGVSGGTGDDYAATYDEWGWFLAHIFAADPTAKTTYYVSANDFHSQTKDAYRLPVTV